MLSSIIMIQKDFCAKHLIFKGEANGIPVKKRYLISYHSQQSTQEMHDFIFSLMLVLL